MRPHFISLKILIVFKSLQKLSIEKLKKKTKTQNSSKKLRGPRGTSPLSSAQVMLKKPDAENAEIT